MMSSCLVRQKGVSNKGQTEWLQTEGKDKNDDDVLCLHWRKKRFWLIAIGTGAFFFFKSSAMARNNCELCCRRGEIWFKSNFRSEPTYLNLISDRPLRHSQDITENTWGWKAKLTAVPRSKCSADRIGELVKPQLLCRGTGLILKIDSRWQEH